MAAAPPCLEAGRCSRPAPLVEAAVGVFGGLPSGLLAVDLLGSAQLVPAGVFDNFRVDPDARHIGDVALGSASARGSGCCGRRGPLPGVSVERRCGATFPPSRTVTSRAGDQFQYAVDLRATNLRLVASKQFAALGVAAGLGWDKYTGDALIQVPTTSLPAARPSVPVELEQLARARLSRMPASGLGLVRLVAEGGYLGGKDQDLTTDFEDFDTTKGKFFAGLGLRVGL